MIDLYKYITESILGDIDTNILTNDTIADIEYCNMKGSEMRKLFNISNDINHPFNIVKENGNNVLECHLNGDFYSIKTYVNGATDYKLSDRFPEIDTVKIFKSGLNIATSKFDKLVCKNVICEGLITVDTNKLSNVNLIAKDLSSNYKSTPIMLFTGKNINLSNCTIENLTAEYFNAYFIGIPTFNNVSSNTVTSMNIMDTFGGVFNTDKIKKVNILNDPKWNRLFDFNYDLTKMLVISNEERTVHVGSMKDLVKLISDKDFYNVEYSEWPYRLKPDVKLSDFIDISKFKKLNTIEIDMGNIRIVLKQGNDKMFYKNNFNNIFKQYWDPTEPGHTANDTFKKIPITADKWRVYIFRNF